MGTQANAADFRTLRDTRVRACRRLHNFCATRDFAVGVLTL
jgi:hypothetical protein